MSVFEKYECEGQMTIFDFLQQDECVINDFWHETVSVLPTNKDWLPALFVIYNSKKNEFYNNIPGEVKDKTFKREAGTPEGNVVAWRYVL